MGSKIYHCLEPDEREAGLSAAVDAVQAGQCIVLPTDTVYGIGAAAKHYFSTDAANLTIAQAATIAAVTPCQGSP